jgi:hypothetical protein
MKKRKLLHIPYSERYDYNFARGFRHGKIEASREILIRVIKLKCKDAGIKPDKSLYAKIYRECDQPLMGKMIWGILAGDINFTDFMQNYDRIVLSPEDIISGKYSVWKSNMKDDE